MTRQQRHLRFIMWYIIHKGSYALDCFRPRSSRRQTPRTGYPHRGGGADVHGFILLLPKKPRKPVDTFACVFSARRAGVGEESCSGLFCLCLVPPDPHNPTHPHLSNSFLRREFCSDGEGGCQSDGTSRSLPTIS